MSFCMPQYNIVRSPVCAIKRLSLSIPNTLVSFEQLSAMQLSFEELIPMLLLLSATEFLTARAVLCNAVAFMAVPCVLQAGLVSAVRWQGTDLAGSMLGGNARQEADRAVAL